MLIWTSNGKNFCGRIKIATVYPELAQTDVLHSDLEAYSNANSDKINAHNLWDLDDSEEKVPRLCDFSNDETEVSDDAVRFGSSSRS